jgi:NADPH:quinone reductase-like Zn-dependent oxidoreductase
VGLAAIDTVKFEGAIPIATTRKSDKRSGLLASGAEHVIATDEEDLVSRVREITNGAGARIIFDPIGGSLLDQLPDTAAPGATIFQYGWLSGEPTPFPLILALQKGLSIRGYWLWETVKDPETFARAKSYVYERVKRGDFQPKIAKVEHKSRGFLRELNSGGATPLEQLSPKEARDLLAALQASAPHNGASRATGSNSSFVRIVPLQPLKLWHGQYLPLRQ